MGWLTPAPGSNKLGAADLATSSQSPSAEGTQRTVAETDIYWNDATNHILYVANPWKGLMALNIADPLAPALSGRLALPGSPYEMVDAGGQLAVMSNPGGNSTNSVVTFVTKPVAGVLASTGTVALGGAIVDSRVVSGVGSGSVLVVATNEWVDTSAAASTSTSTGGTSSSVSVSPGMFAGPTSFQATVWVVDLGTGQKLSQFSVPGSCSAVSVSEEAVYVASSAVGWGSRFHPDAVRNPGRWHVGAEPEAGGHRRLRSGPL